MLTIYIVIIILDYVSTKYSVIKSENEILKLKLQLEKLEQKKKGIQPYNECV